MTLPTSGNSISLSRIQTEFGGSNPIGLNEYYKNGSHVGSFFTSVPTSGAIDLADFFGMQNGVGTTNINIPWY
jgi:hypothetical protein